MEKFSEKRKILHMVFIDLKKVYNRVARKLIWPNIEVKKKIHKRYNEILQDMYKGTVTRARMIVVSYPREC